MLKKEIFLFLIFLIECINNINNIDNEIIGIPPLKFDSEFTIITKNGLINYYLGKSLIGSYSENMMYFIADCWIVNYRFENWKNLELSQNILKHKEKNGIHYEISGEKKDKIYLELHARKELINHYKIICELLYSTKYINKLIVTVVSNITDIDNMQYKYFGGTPQKLVENLDKYTFNTNNIISEIEFSFNYNTYNIKSNSTENNKVEFNDDSHLICFSKSIFNNLEKLLFKYYNKTTYYYDIEYDENEIYDLNEKQKDLFPSEIKFKINNKFFS